MINRLLFIAALLSSASAFADQRQDVLTLLNPNLNLTVGAYDTGKRCALVLNSGYLEDAGIMRPYVSFDFQIYDFVAGIDVGYTAGLWTDEYTLNRPLAEWSFAHNSIVYRAKSLASSVGAATLEFNQSNNKITSYTVEYRNGRSVICRF
jgi:hypothetical protein